MIGVVRISPMGSHRDTNTSFCLTCLQRKVHHTGMCIRPEDLQKLTDSVQCCPSNLAQMGESTFEDLVTPFKVDATWDSVPYQYQQHNPRGTVTISCEGLPPEHEYGAPCRQCHYYRDAACRITAARIYWQLVAAPLLTPRLSWCRWNMSYAKVSRNPGMFWWLQFTNSLTPNIQHRRTFHYI